MQALAGVLLPLPLPEAKKDFFLMSLQAMLQELPYGEQLTEEITGIYSQQQVLTV